MTDEDVLIAGVVADPHLDTPRTVLADWLDDNEQPERAAVVRLHWPRRQVNEPRLLADVLAERGGPVTRMADRLEAEGMAAFGAYSRRQMLISSETLPPADVWAEAVEWEYDTLLANWRRWLPPSVTTLTRRADREAYNQDYFSPAVTFPSRRRPSRYTPGSMNPSMSVLFAWGLPEWVECDAEDWRRAGADLVRRFPWIVYEPGGF